MKDKQIVELSKMDVPLKTFIKTGYNTIPSHNPINRKPQSHTLYYILSGEVEFKVGEKTYSCKENCIIHLSDKEYAVIRNISPINKAALYYVMFELTEDKTLSNLGVPRVTRDLDGEILSRIKLLYKTYLGEGIAYKLRLYGEFSLLLYELISGGYSEDNIFNVNLKISKAVQYIRMNYYKNISLETLSDIAGYSVSHFRKLFVNAYGMPPREYMINYRIRKAKEFLSEDSGKTIEEIAELVGMCNASYFCKIFKDKTGITPHKYKNIDNMEML